MTIDPKGKYHSPYLGMGNNPISRIDPNGGSDGGPGDPPTINLDTVVITGKCAPNCGNNTPHLAKIDIRSFDPSFPTWTTSFKGNSNDWNKKNGTNFKDHYAAYAFWLELQKQREMDAFMSDFNKKRKEWSIGILTMIGVGIAPIAIFELAPIASPYFSTSFAKGYAEHLAFETFSEIVSKKGNLGNVNLLGIAASAFAPKIGNKIVSSKFSLTFNKGLIINSTSQTVINFTVGEINGGIHSNLSKFSNALGGKGAVEGYRIVFTRAGQTGIKYISNGF